MLYTYAYDGYVDDDVDQSNDGDNKELSTQLFSSIL